MAQNAEPSSKVATPISTSRLDIGLLCSVKCPGKLIMAAYDLAQTLGRAGAQVISGFHSPMEQECLRILLRSPTPVTWCLARGKLTRIPPELKKPVADGRLRILAPFPNTVRRVTIATSERRNQIVADMSAAIVVVHAAPGSKIERLSTELLAANRPLFTFDHPANSVLIHAGAQVVRSDMDWNKIVAAFRPTYGRAQT